MKTQFIPIDYDYFDFNERNFIRIFGRDNTGQRVCVIDSCPVYFWAILTPEAAKDDKKINKLVKEIEKIQLDVKGRHTRVEAVEVHDKNFLGEEVRALKIFATNYKDLHDIADELDFDEIDKRRGYDLGLITHYIMEKNINPLYWYELEGEAIDNSQELGGVGMAVETDLCIKANSFKELKGIDNKKSKSEKSGKEKEFKPKVLAYDIETDEVKIGEGEILMISLVCGDFKKVITWDKDRKKGTKLSEDIKDNVEYVEDEAELIEKFVEYTKDISPDFLTGYFSDGFDLPYIKARAEKFNMKLPLSLDGTQPRFSRGGGILTGKIKGLPHIDLWKFIRTAYSQYLNSETLSLDEVSKELLGNKKEDFKLKHSSDIQGGEWDDYYRYNLQDSILTHDLFMKVWRDLAEFTRIIKAPVVEVSRNGMSTNVETFILNNLEKFNEIPEKRPVRNEIMERRQKGKYEGGFVYEPTPGIYENIVMFDFTSSYASVIVSYNLSKSTFVEKPSERNDEEYFEINTEDETVHFEKQEGFIPELLREIVERRKEYKKELKKNPDDNVKRARSNAFKLLANSYYGYQGFFGARYYSREAASATAAFARKSIKDVMENIQGRGYDVVYGDSVGGKTKVWIKKGKKLLKVNIEDLFKNVDKKVSGKEYDLKKGLKVLTLDERGNSVFKPLKYIMRHKTDKKMYKVNFTNNWSIDVTEDHSLIAYQSCHFNRSNKCKDNVLERLTEINPAQIHKKANSIVSLKKIPREEHSSKDYPKEVYEFIGFFIGDGSFCQNKNQKINNKDYYLGLSCGNDCDEVIRKLIIPLKNKGWIKNYWKSNTRKGDIKINGQKLIKIIREYCKNKNKKAFPSFLFQEKEENVEAFLRGYFSADGTVMIRNKSPIIKLTSINKDFIEKTRDLLYLCGISNTCFKDGTSNKYKEYTNNTFSKNVLIKDKESFAKKVGFFLNRKNRKANIKSKAIQKKLIKKYGFDLQYIKSIDEIPSQGYVYDIEVEDTHRFFANNVLVHNTDSIALLQGKKSKKEIMDLLKGLNSELPGIMELELEGVFERGIWVTKRTGKTGAKKKYALIDEDGKIKIRGFETVRRDWCSLARHVQNKVLELVLKHGNEEKAMEFLKKVTKEIKNREVNKEDLVIKTQLKKPLSEYKAVSPHVIAARKMKEKGVPIKQGGLVEYYVASPGGNGGDSGKNKKLVRERVKLPFEEGDYDIEYYLNHQILPAVENILRVFDVDIKEIIDGKKQTTLGDF